MDTLKFYVDGQWSDPVGSAAQLGVENPATECSFAHIHLGQPQDVDRAVRAARRAFDESDWSRDLEFRYHCLTQLHEALERNKEHLRRVLITEVGCPVKVTGSQIESPIEEVKHWAEHGKPQPYEAGSWGPASADEMLAREGRTWRRP